MWATLHEIRTYEKGRLYRSQGFESFQAYCLAKWGYAKARALRALAAMRAAVGRLDGLEGLTILEDSEGHEPTRAAETAGLSQLLAHHACVLGLLRSRGVRVDALLTGTGHSAAFFANALQADRVEALPGARVVAMDVSAMARVLRLDPARLASLVEDDPLLGHPVRHFAALGGATIVER